MVSTSIDRFKPRPPKRPALPKVPAGMGRQRGVPKIGNPIRQYGPQILKRFAEVVLVDDWTIPPSGFVGAQTSKSEWMIYAALALVTGSPKEPRRPPFIGGVTWQYQSPLGGGRMERGGQVCDFLVDQPGKRKKCLRLQTEYFHIQTDRVKVQQDRDLKTHTRGVDIVDIYDQEYIGDRTLRSACRVVANALAGREEKNPSLFGTSQRIR